MTLKTVLSNIRAAFRAQLQTVVDIDVTVTVTASGGVLTRSTGSWIDDGFAIGQEVTLSGVGAGTAIVRGVDATKLSLSSTTSGSGSARVQVKLPAAVAWEGTRYVPRAVPFVAEKVQSATTIRRSVGPQGAIEHRILGHANRFYPSLGSTLAIERMAGSIMTAFKPGTQLVRNGDAAIVQQVEQSPLLLDGEWISQNVTVTALAFTLQ
jgi:hypothetical protein